MIEIFTLFILPLIKKIVEKSGDKIIDDLADGIDNKLKELIKNALSNPSGEVELMAYLDRHENVKKQLHAKSGYVLQFQDRLTCYSVVFDRIAHIAIKLRTDLILAGFLNSPLAVSVINCDGGWYRGIISGNNSISLDPLTFSVSIEFHETEEKRDKRIEELREAIEDNNRRIPPDLLVEAYAVAFVYDGSIGLTGWQNGDLDAVEPATRASVEKGQNVGLYGLPEKVKVKLKIRDNEGLSTMVKSASGFMAKKAKEIADLNKKSQS